MSQHSPPSQCTIPHKHNPCLFPDGVLIHFIDTSVMVSLGNLAMVPIPLCFALVAPWLWTRLGGPPVTQGLGLELQDLSRPVSFSFSPQTPRCQSKTLEWIQLAAANDSNLDLGAAPTHADCLEQSLLLAPG